MPLPLQKKYRLISVFIWIFLILGLLLLILGRRGENRKDNEILELNKLSSLCQEYHLDVYRFNFTGDVYIADLKRTFLYWKEQHIHLINDRLEPDLEGHQNHTNWFFQINRLLDEQENNLRAIEQGDRPDVLKIQQNTFDYLFILGKIHVQVQESKEDLNIWLTILLFIVVNCLIISFSLLWLLVIQPAFRLIDKKSEQSALQDELMRAVLNSTPDGHLLVGTNFKILSFNKVVTRQFKSITGIDLQAGLDIREILPASEKESFPVLFEESLQGKIIRTERKLRYKDGQELWFEISFNPVYDNPKQIVGVAYNLANIHERKQIENKYRLQNQQLRKISWKQSHELRGPLSSIMNLLAVMKEDSRPENQKEYLDMMTDATTRLDDSMKKIIQESLLQEINSSFPFESGVDSVRET